MRRALAALVSAAALGVSASNASAAISVSSNWSGYAVTGTTFSSVGGSWVQPAATCSAGSGTTASAFWVGLGGASSSSSALEQTGTEADCAAGGTASYSAWYELVPAASVKVGLKVSAGDRISASVKVEGTSVTLTLANLTTGKTFSKTLKMASPNVSSAEWIAEAPSAVSSRGTTVLPLTDFGTASFSSATATSTSGHSGSISDPAWSATRIELQSGSSGGRGDPFGPFAAYDQSATLAVPSRLSSAGGRFSVTWHRTTVAAGPPAGI